MKKMIIAALATFLLNNNSFSQFANGCFLQGMASSMGTIYTSSGNAEIDRVTNQELVFLSSRLLVTPAFFFYDDSRGSNAFFTPTISDNRYPDGTVCLGLNLLAKQMRISQGGTNVPIILAHEFGHVVAKKYSVLFTSGKDGELFADYLAGAYMYLRHIAFKPTDIDAAMDEFASMGDDNFTDPGHHGTAESRLTCLQQGFDDCQNAVLMDTRFELRDAISMGKDFVISNDFD